MAEAEQHQSKGRIRRWLDKRRESQRRGAEMTERAKSVRRADDDRARSGGPTKGGGGGRAPDVGAGF